MSYKDTDKCIAKALPDEMLFVLMARDPTAPEVVGEWIKNNLRTQPREKLIEALDAAIMMVKTQQGMVAKKSGIFKKGYVPHPCDEGCINEDGPCREVCAKFGYSARASKDNSAHGHTEGSDL